MRIALVIGINNYPKAKLYGCTNDARAVADLLSVNADGSKNFDVRLETDVFTRPVLRSKIVKLFATECETALFYFSGHGMINTVGGYIVTPDAETYDEGILMDEVLKLANASKALNKIIILDCCHAGKMGSPSLLGNGTSFISDGVIILCASKHDEPSIENSGHGVFTNLLIEALEGISADLTGHVTPGSIYAHIDKALGPWDQRPVFKANTTHFISLRTVKPPIANELLGKITVYFPAPNSEFKLDRTYEYTNTEARTEHVAVFKELQKMQSVGLVAPTGEEFMFWAAQNGKSCHLTTLGGHYWTLVNNKRI